uniref:Uncharacterized protein n=1 Tax=Romanomermis culicivorax TaxID=13658 RepID=A0A915KZQ6_ROMCU
MSKEGDEAEFEIIVEDEIGDEEENTEPTSVERINEKGLPVVEEVSKSSDIAEVIVVTTAVGASSLNVLEVPEHVVVREEIPAVPTDLAPQLESDQKIETVAEIKNVPPASSDVNDYKEADIEEIAEIPISSDQKEVVQPVSEEDSADEVEEYTVEDSIEDEEKDDQTALAQESIADLGQETDGMEVDSKRNGDTVDNVQNDTVSGESPNFLGDIEQDNLENDPVEVSFNESASSMSDSIEIVDDLSKNEDIVENEAANVKEVASDELKLVQHNGDTNDNKNGKPAVE